MSGKRLKLSLLPVIAAFCPLSMPAQGLDGIITRLRATDCFQATADYAVELPQAIDDVVYTVKLSARANGGDPLSPADYLIDWFVPVESGTSSGFSAYFNGHHYRYRDERLLEYHVAADSLPFLAQHRGPASIPGVQRSAQFVTLLPHFIADELEAAAANPDYKITVGAAAGRITVSAELITEGYLCSEFRYTFDSATGRPLTLTANYNPGAMTEQTLSVSYVYPPSAPECQPLTEERLISLYPREFEQFRESTFAIDNIPGKHLPAFSLPTPDARRITRHTGDEFPSPVIVVLLDPDSKLTGRLMADIRSAVDKLAAEVAVLWAFSGNRTDDIEPLLDSSRPEESAAMSAGPLARDCGAPVLPVTLVCRPDATIHKVIVGYNNNMTADVIEGLTTL